ncbi:uncharacterized protein EV422DRAFT_541706 [Fimicolochytrium jonesii]|uniref:uncharacterized protein n=1 Tax=Fimicolochytrium jonesii TaxID=1396493 RepID=UPI0022FE9DC7|nr:uncharacterized protein EV422DRAFT_541706 [Fimicolochytrium jonesii]KAI8817410.1 hypothetical protein EV422DRAFT_541706 [Fimicolochytrium jonesii]
MGDTPPSPPPATYTSGEIAGTSVVTAAFCLVSLGNLYFANRWAQERRRDGAPLKRADKLSLTSHFIFVLWAAISGRWCYKFAFPLSDDAAIALYAIANTLFTTGCFMRFVSLLPWLRVVRRTKELSVIWERLHIGLTMTIYLLAQGGIIVISIILSQKDSEGLSNLLTSVSGGYLGVVMIATACLVTKIIIDIKSELVFMLKSSELAKLSRSSRNVASPPTSPDTGMDVAQTQDTLKWFIEKRRAMIGLATFSLVLAVATLLTMWIGIMLKLDSRGALILFPETYMSALLYVENIAYGLAHFEKAKAGEDVARGSEREWSVGLFTASVIGRWVKVLTSPISSIANRSRSDTIGVISMEGRNGRRETKGELSSWRNDSRESKGSNSQIGPSKSQVGPSRSQADPPKSEFNSALS